MKFLIVTAVDGTEIPVLAHLVGENAYITVDGDGSCRLNSQDAYLVSIVNASRSLSLREKTKKLGEAAAEKGKDAAVDKIEDVVKEELIPAVLRAMSLKQIAGYVARGAKLLGSAPAQLVGAMFLDAQEIGEEKWHCYRQALPDDQSALIRWFGAAD